MAATGRSRVPARQAEMRIAARTEIILRCVPWVGALILMVASPLPIRAMRPWVDEIAGKNTHVTISITVTIAISIALSTTCLVQRARLKRQHTELTRLRGRLEALDSKRVPR